METINALRIELAEEVATLPEALRSNFPDLAVDFLYTVFKDDVHRPMPRLPTSALAKAETAAEEAAAAAPSPPPFPSEERLEAARAFSSKVEAEAVALASAAAPRPESFAALLGHREPAGGDSTEGSLTGLVRCERCSRVMFASVKDAHAETCTLPPAPAAPSSSDKQHAGAAPSMDTAREGGSKGKKRRAAGDGSGFGASKLRIPRGGSVPAVASAVPGEAAPLSPVLRAAAANRQGRSLANTERRRLLTFHPGIDLDSPLRLNASPRAGQAPRTGEMVPMRMASQNGELSMRMSAGAGAAAGAQQKPPTGGRGKGRGTKGSTKAAAATVAPPVAALPPAGQFNPTAAAAAAPRPAAVADPQQRAQFLAKYNAMTPEQQHQVRLMIARQQQMAVAAATAAGGQTPGAAQPPPGMSQQNYQQMQAIRDNMIRQQQQQQQRQQQQGYATAGAPPGPAAVLSGQQVGAQVLPHGYAVASQPTAYPTHLYTQQQQQQQQYAYASPAAVGYAPQAPAQQQQQQQQQLAPGMVPVQGYPSTGAPTWSHASYQQPPPQMTYQQPASAVPQYQQYPAPQQSYAPAQGAPVLGQVHHAHQGYYGHQQAGQVGQYGAGQVPGMPPPMNMMQRVQQAQQGAAMYPMSPAAQFHPPPAGTVPK